MDEQQQQQRYGYVLYDPEADPAMAITPLWSPIPPPGAPVPQKRHAPGPPARRATPAPTLAPTAVPNTAAAPAPAPAPVTSSSSALAARLAKKKLELTKGT